MATGADSDLQLPLTRKRERGGHVGLAGGLHDQLGEAIGDAAVPDAIEARLLVAGLAAAQQVAFDRRHQPFGPYCA